MKIDNSQYNCSLNDTSDLRKLILENPDLPLLVFCSEESWIGEWCYNQSDVRSCKIQSLALCRDMWVDEEEYREYLVDALCDKDEYKDLSDDEYYKMIDEKVAETAFCQAIVIYVG